MSSSTIKQLSDWHTDLASITDQNSSFHRDLTEALEQESVKQAQSCFDRQSDPYGSRWQETKGVGGSPARAPIQSLREGMTVQAGTNGFVMGHENPVAVYHLFGTRRGLPQRAWLPMEDRGVPAEWNEGFARVAEEVRKKHFGQ